MILEALRVSLGIALAATAIVAVLGTAVGWLVARRSFPGRELLDALLMMPLFLPPTVVGFALLALLGRRGLLGSLLWEGAGVAIAFTPAAAVVAASVVSFPLMYRSARAAIEAVDPRYPLASATLGRGPGETFLRVILPLARRGLLAGVVLSFARALGEFGATLMFAGNIPGRTRTLSIATWEAAMSGEDERARVLALILAGVSVVAVLLVARIGRPPAEG